MPAGQAQALRPPPAGLDPDAVVGGVGAREHAGRAPAQAQRIDGRVLERLPRALQQQPLLRIHRQRLPRRDREHARRRTRPRRRRTRPDAHSSSPAGSRRGRTAAPGPSPDPSGTRRSRRRPTPPAPTDPPPSGRRPDSGSRSPRSRSARPAAVTRGAGAAAVRPRFSTSSRSSLATAAGVGWSNTSVAGSVSPLAAAIRLRSSTADERVEAELLERRGPRRSLRGGLAEDRRRVRAHQLEHDAVALRLGRRREHAAKRRRLTAGGAARARVRAR